MKFQSKRAAQPILKFLKSSVASAANNFNLPPENLRIFNIFVDQGPMLKRFRPRAFGRAGEIQKKTSHITMILEEKASTADKIKRKSVEKTTVKKIEEKKPAAPKYETPKIIKPTQRLKGFTKKIFRRKAIG